MTPRRKYFNGGSKLTTKNETNALYFALTIYIIWGFTLYERIRGVVSIIYRSLAWQLGVNAALIKE